MMNLYRFSSLSHSFGRSGASARPRYLATSLAPRPASSFWRRVSKTAILLSFKVLSESAPGTRDGPEADEG